jgi:hypothetical protein
MGGWEDGSVMEEGWIGRQLSGRQMEELMDGRTDGCMEG